METKEKLNIRPTVGLLGLLKNMRYTEWYALGEFVDNAVQSYSTHKKELKKINTNYKLKIKIDIFSSEIIIRDNAAGINTDRYNAAFETGKPPPDRGGLSEFGVGMKIAACWFGDKWKVHTKAINENFWRLVEFDISKIQEKNISELDVTKNSAAGKQSYTIVTLSKLNHKPKGAAIGRIKEHLSSMYRHLLNDGEIEIFVNNKKLSYHQPVIRNSTYYKDWEDGIVKKPKKIKWYKKFHFDYKAQKVFGFVAIRAVGKVSQEGFSLFRRKRLITGTMQNPFKPTAIMGQSNDRRSQVIFGEVHLDHMPVAFSKNDFVWDESEKDKFISLLKKATEFYDDKKEISLNLQAKNWTESLERDDIRADSKQGLEQVEKFLSKGLESAIKIINEPIPLNKKHESAKENDSGSKLNCIFLGNSYQIQVIYEYDNNQKDLYDIELIDKKKIKVFLNFKHSFAQRFFTTNNERTGFSIILAYLAVCEVHLTKKEGVKDASLLRARLNEICEKIPPKT